MSRSELIQLNRTTYGVANACYRYTGMSGVIGAGLADGAVVAAWDFSQFLPQSHPYFIERVRVDVTTITAFAVPVTAGRALALTRLDAMPVAAGTCFRTDKSTGVSAVSDQMAISTTAALAGAVVQGSPLWLLPLTSIGASGANREFTLNFGLEVANLRFNFGFLGLVAFGAFDAAGTTQITAELDLEWAGGL